MKLITRIAATAAFTAVALTATAGPLDKTECIAPAKPGGGFDLTCKLVQSALVDGKFIADPMRVTYMPGGIGAVAYNTVIAQKPDAANAIVAFSGGSLLNLAQGKFVAENSSFKSLKDVMAAMKADPTKVVLGAGGSVGSQDWMKAALTARAGGVNPKTMRYVAFEGGGEALTALQGGHIQVFTGDAAEAMQQIKAGAKVRILAVMNDKRLPGDMAKIPTAAEQGYDVEWPIVRGFYVGPKVSDADYKVWVDTFNKMLATPAYEKLRDERGLFPLALTGAPLDAYVKKQVAGYRKLAEEFGLNVVPAK